MEVHQPGLCAKEVGFHLNNGTHPPVQNYQQICGVSIDVLWGLERAHHRIPQWHARLNPKEKKPTEPDFDDDEPPGMVPFKSKSKNGKSSGAKPGGPRAITAGDGNTTDGSMPSLQTVSDSSDEETDFDSDGDDGLEDDDEEEDDDTDTDYDTDEEDEIRDLLREAMDTAAATPDFFDPRAEAPDFDALAEDRRGNPFIKLLGSLRGG